MKNRRYAPAGLLLFLAFTPSACGQAKSYSSREGYLSAATLPDMMKVLPPAPEPGDARDRRDHEIFVETQKLEGTPRWTLATSDADISIAALLRTFSCAMGVLLDPRKAPVLAGLLSKVIVDSNASVNHLKPIYQRKRPFQEQPAQICAPASGPDYPSGHSSIGFAMGMVLAELEPERATQLLERGRAFGESRVVCGVHYESAVEAGRIHAAALLAVLHGVPAFRADLEAARQELKDLRTNPAAPAGCDAEAALISKRWFHAP